MKDKIVEILKLYEDPAEDLNHNLYDTIAEEIAHLYSAGEEDELISDGQGWIKVSKTTRPTVSEEEIKDIFEGYANYSDFDGTSLMDIKGFALAINELLNR